MPKKDRPRRKAGSSDAAIVTSIGHTVISRELEVAEVAAATEREHPDLAFVGLGIDGLHALEMISEIVREAACPVIALLESDDPVWVNEAAKRGIFAYIVNGNPDEMQSAIDITIERYAEYKNLEGAFASRAMIERAKGLLMAQAGARRAGSLPTSPRPSRRAAAPRSSISRHSSSTRRAACSQPREGGGAGLCPAGAARPVCPQRPRLAVPGAWLRVRGRRG